MAKIIHLPAPTLVEDYLFTLLPDPVIRKQSENVQRLREILSRMYIAGTASPGETDWEKLRWFIHDSLLDMDELEVIHGVQTIQVIASALEELQFPGKDPE